MNEVTIMYQNIETKPWEDKFLSFVDSVLKDQEIDNWEFSLTLCDDTYIQGINREYRDKDKPTDVITFVMSDEPFPMAESEDELYSSGDIIISLDTVKENSKYFNVNEEEELKRVVVHGILHLMGLDHKTNDVDEEMLMLQEKILLRLPQKGIYI